jgi:L-asparaginase II
MEPLSVVARRGGIVEARHRVHAVAVRDGNVVAAHGDPELVCFMRSSSKPLQALPLARARDDLDERDLAIASASHRGLPEHVAAVRALLDKAGATEDDLELGAPPRRSKIEHNCSGKHAGMLALCRARGWETRGYRLPEHPVQQACRDAHAEAAAVLPDELPAAADGCGVVTFALSLRRMAHAFARFGALDGGDRVAAAMRAHPFLVGGPDGADCALMTDAPGWIAKSGAEGLLCAAGPDGLGVALKTEDGSFRPHLPALGALFGLEQHAVVRLANSLGEPVGELAVEDRQTENPVFTKL